MQTDARLEKIERLNLVLTTIRDVGRLLVSQRDKGELVQGICDILVGQRGYYNAWIGLTDVEGTVFLVADAGFAGRFDKVRKEVLGQNFTRCIKKTLASDQVVVVLDPVKECTDCLLALEYADRGGLAVRLVHDQTDFGFMVLSIPKHLAADATEKHIVKEMADDIAAALYRLDLEEKQRKAEQATRKSRARFKTLIENSLNYISIIQNNEIVYQKPGLRRVHSLMTHVFNPPRFLHVYKGDRDRIQEQYQALQTGRINRLEADFRYYPKGFAKEESQVRWALISATRIDYLGKESVLTNIMDITDSKEVENFLRIQDKMTSLGRVTAGIAHEIRNPLSGIYIYLKALKKIYNEMGDITKVVSIIDKIELASDKIESIIKRVMDFSRPGQPRFVFADLNAYIDDVTKLTAVTLRKSGISFVKQLDPDIPDCYVEPHLIEQVVLNLITNAAEAMKGFSGEKQIRLTTTKTCDHVIIQIKDTGPGIPISQQSKVFDPFFTTKANSSGIGLSICHRIILDHGGVLKLNSAKNKGTRFTIELPLKTREGKNG
ncbi:MAG: GHKL domain-containing protein [Desulfotignum sp.]|nr:GHKL domain-containing protein [Desulfotignum sp.]MCF8112228.1 GHKL domain-containing protein [Desulfotignum sp.]MCF8125774.1 GHKL domain-containing protein [Desulfotignum sp.]